MGKVCLECMPVFTHAAFNEIQKAVALTLQAQGKEAAGKGVLRELGFEAIGLWSDHLGTHARGVEGLEPPTNDV